MSVVHEHPTTNSEAFALIARHLSPHKAEAFRALGIDVVQGRREGVRIGGLEGRDYITAVAPAGYSISATIRSSRWTR